MTVAPSVIDAIRWQRTGMDHPHGSPLYAHLLDVTVADIERGGPCADVFEHTPECDPVADALALRFLSGVHRIVLRGDAAGLAAVFPSAGGRYDHNDPSCDPDEMFVAAVADNHAELVE